MPRFHVTAKGDPGLCAATVQECPLKEEDGSPTPHGDFKDAKEARAFAEKVTEKRFGGAFGDKPAKAEKNEAMIHKPAATPAPAPKRVLSDPKTVEEARELWNGLLQKAYRDDYGRPRFYPIHPDPLEDMAARNFAADDAEAAKYAIEALRHGYGVDSTRTKDFVAQLGRSANPEVRALMAEAVEWHNDLVGELSQDKDSRVRQNLAAQMGRLNAKLERDTQHRDRVYVIADTSDETNEARRKLSVASERLARDPELAVRKTLAESSDWRDEKAQSILAKDQDPAIRTIVAGRMSSMAKLAAEDSDDADVFQGHTRQNPRYNSRVNLVGVSRTLAEDPDVSVRKTLAGSENWMDDKTQRTLARDSNADVRFVLANNAKTSKLDAKAVKYLTKDREPSIRASIIQSGAPLSDRTLRRMTHDINPAVAAIAYNRQGVPFDPSKF